MAIFAFFSLSFFMRISFVDIFFLSRFIFALSGERTCSLRHGEPRSETNRQPPAQDEGLFRTSSTVSALHSAVESLLSSFHQPIYLVQHAPVSTIPAVLQNPLGWLASMPPDARPPPGETSG